VKDMAIFVRFIGLFISSVGFLFLVKPQIFKRFIVSLKIRKRFYLIGIFRLILGIILIWGGKFCRLSGLVTIIGIVFLIAGVFIFLIGPKRLNVILEWWINKPIIALRTMAIVPIFLGVLLLYAA
jgi:hypothetical protein